MCVLVAHRLYLHNSATLYVQYCRSKMPFLLRYVNSFTYTLPSTNIGTSVKHEQNRLQTNSLLLIFLIFHLKDEEKSNLGLKYAHTYTPTHIRSHSKATLICLIFNPSGQAREQGWWKKRSNKLSVHLGSGAHPAINESQLTLNWMEMWAPFKKSREGTERERWTSVQHKLWFSCFVCVKS